MTPVLTYPIIITVGMGKMAQVVILVPYIQKKASSNLSWHNGYNDIYCGISQSNKKIPR